MLKISNCSDKTINCKQRGFHAHLLVLYYPLRRTPERRRGNRSRRDSLAVLCSRSVWRAAKQNGGRKREQNHSTPKKKRYGMKRMQCQLSKQREDFSNRSIAEMHGRTQKAPSFLLKMHPIPTRRMCSGVPLAFFGHRMP